jgi:hypothetical protein
MVTRSNVLEFTMRIAMLSHVNFSFSFPLCCWVFLKKPPLWKAPMIIGIETLRGDESAGRGTNGAAETAVASYSGFGTLCGSLGAHLCSALVPV